MGEKKPRPRTPEEKPPIEQEPDPVDQAAMESFPASDPPSYSPLRAGEPEEQSDDPRPSRRDPSSEH
jgi:hypothetical protein